MNQERPPFTVAPEQTRFKVVDGEGRTMLVCDGEANAGQYAALMNESYQRGFKAGYRHARQLHHGAGTPK